MQVVSLLGEFRFVMIKYEYHKLNIYYSPN